MLNFPLGLYGSGSALEGDLDGIMDMVGRFSSVASVECWGRDRTGLQSYNPTPAIPTFFTKLSNGIPFQVDLRVTRESTLPPKPRGYLFRSWVIRDLLDHRFSYLVWRGWTDMCSDRLIGAAGKGYPRIVRMLLKMGADIHTMNPVSGATPLTEAEKGGHMEVVRILKEAGAWKT